MTMNTFLGVDNVREGQIILACKEMRPTGEIRQLWREKLRDLTTDVLKSRLFF